MTHLPSTTPAADVDCIGTKPMLVWVLVPVVVTDDPTLDYYNDYSQSQAEFARAFAALGVAWRWQPVAMHEIREVIDTIARETTHAPVVFNLCDGDETNGVPGISVIRLLDEAGLPYSGADQPFYRVTTSKIDMKHAFDRAGVSTAPWEVIPRSSTALGGLFKRHGSPLILKPAISAGSMGITVDSVVTSATALRKQIRLLDEGYRGWDLVSGGVFVERYIAGPEFTTLIVGCADAPDRSIVYPAVERVFHAALPPTEQFLSFDRLWEVYERESSLGEGEYLWQYGAAPAELQERICDLSWAAYCAVGGRGYGRVDLRLDAATSELFVLEVNAQCGLSEDENYTSIGAILRLAGRSFSSMVRDIVADAMSAHATRAAQMSA